MVNKLKEKQKQEINWKNTQTKKNTYKDDKAQFKRK